jgi:uncharacterized protein YbcC (UPF0753/DUF2309 family)
MAYAMNPSHATLSRFTSLEKESLASMPDPLTCDVPQASCDASLIDSLPAPEDLAAQITAACLRIAPLWPLKEFVAVNPFVGLSATSFVDACALMRRVTHGELAMPAAYYQERLQQGLILDADLQSALDQARQILPAEHATIVEPWTVETLKSALQARLRNPDAAVIADRVLTVADLLDSGPSAIIPGWQAFVVDEISKWCSAYYDEGQASWRMPWRDAPLYTAWREAARQDANPEMMGLRGFRACVRSLPTDATEAIKAALRELEVAPARTVDFLHRALMSIAGWSGYVQYRVRANAMNAVEDDSLRQLLAIRLAYDVALYRRHSALEFRRRWAECAVPASGPPADLPALLGSHLWQLAAEAAYQRTLLSVLGTVPPVAQPASLRPAVQMVFCIDVRSEPFRRAFEAESPQVETLGFAGFFGFPIEYVPFGQEQGRAQCPVLLKPAFRIRETLSDLSPIQERKARRASEFSQRLGHGWNAFKTSAVSCFSFVETAGLLSGIKLVKETLGLHPHAPTSPNLAPTVQRETELQDTSAPLSGMSLSDQIAVAANALHKMGLTSRFARLVVFCGHGSQTANNPYAAALDCGACGGHSGEANARVAAAVLNSLPVREGLRERGIAIPEDTLFLAGLHNTTTDAVSLFDVTAASPTHRAEVQQLQEWLAAASHRARLQRAGALGYGDLSGAETDRQVEARSHDWAQTRPEWGLAGNAAFLIAPRARTREMDLGGRVFLHSYDSATDADGSVLELILTAPMVVASWINLQYFASTVNNERFGSGNKTIHNVVGTMGIWQGNSGDLQVGLPLQSLHDGRNWRHEPLRLTVVIEASRSALNRVIAANQGVRELLDNAWLHLLAIESEEEGRRIFRYGGDLHWKPVEGLLAMEPILP